MNKGEIMIQPDTWIKEQAENGMIVPFEPKLVREFCPPKQKGFFRKAISYGASSYGYDLRLSPADFQIFRHRPGQIVNPKRFDPKQLEPAELHSDEDGDYFIIPAHSYGLGVALERLHVPNDVTVICLGKSTYARCGIIANVTPAESGWHGYLTLEFSNSSSADCRIFANEGVIQLLFFKGEPCLTTYEDRNGKYQGQLQKVTIAQA